MIQFPLSSAMRIWVILRAIVIVTLLVLIGRVFPHASPVDWIPKQEAGHLKSV